ARARGVAARDKHDAPAEQSPRHACRRRIVCAYARAAAQQPFDDWNRGRLAHVVGPRLERQAPEGAGPALEAPEVLLHLRNQPLLLRLVHALDRPQGLKVVTTIL